MTISNTRVIGARSTEPPRPPVAGRTRWRRLALVMVPAPVPMLAAAVLFGWGFGVLQNASLTLMFNRADADRYGEVSAVWNIAFDAAMGLGAAGFGVVANAAGYPAAFATTGLLMLLAVAPAWRDRARSLA